ncbi:MAG: hypothetical protein D6701_03355 [Gemmatimonadetes bacterium]|nr:MAG: hypothetical protein D6701_03355 [Gemmatimonadota bacterium]
MPTLALSGSMRLFGHDPTAAEARLVPRTARWRWSRAALRMGIALVLAPLAALVPPHAPWALGVLGVGFVLARRRWRERYTLVRAEGRCPRCGADLRLERPAPLASPHAFSCGTCHHEPALYLDPDEGRD